MKMPSRLTLLLLVSMIIFLQASFSHDALFAAVKSKKKATKPKKAAAKILPAEPKPLPVVQDVQKPLPFKIPPSPKLTQNMPERGEKIGLTVGIKAGASAGLTGAIGDVSYSLNQFLPGASIRGSVGYLTGRSSSVVSNDLKLSMVNLDAVYDIENLGSPTSPFKAYLGGGVIYPLKVNRNRGAGAWGAHAYFGSRYLLQDSTSIFGELAYTGIKYQADEAAIRGVEAMLGYSYSF